jgi:hypothetical protein
MIKMFMLEFLITCHNHLETIHGQQTWQIEILEHDFIDSVIT